MLMVNCQVLRLQGVKNSNLETTLYKLQRLKAKLEENVSGCFNQYQTYLMHEVDLNRPTEVDVLVYSFNYMLYLLHQQNVIVPTENVEESKTQNQWCIPYSELSKSMQLSFLIEYETESGRASQQFNLPFIFKMNVEKLSK